MKKTHIIIGVIILALLAVGAWYLFSSKGSPAGTPTTNTGAESSVTGDTASNVTPAATPVKGTGTLKSAFTQGGNYTCTLSTLASNNGQTSGVIYASGAKTRVDFQSKTAAGVVSEVHIIRDGTYSYTWIAGQTTGIKTQITSSSSIVPHQPSGSGFSLDDTSSINWDCHPWLTNKTQFVPPTNITFVAG
ncbi:MAG: hypothetical protein V4437_00770 [Patescibacteria group bacterium]